MNNKAGILQQGIEIRPLQGSIGQQAFERIGCKQGKGHETHSYTTHHRQHPRQHQQRQLATEDSDSGGPQAEDQRPQQE